MNKASINFILDARPPSRKCPVHAAQKAMEKRLYNRERQQHLRRIENHERQMLKVQIHELELELQRLQHRGRPSQSPSSLLPAEVENRSLKRRMHEYSSFMYEMANWATQITQSISSDAAWMAGLDHDDDNNRPSNNAATVEALDVENLPSGHRKRLYNRMRQRLYRRREVEEADLLQQQVVELTATLDALTKAPAEAERHSRADLDRSRNHELKCRLDEHQELAHSMLGWIAHTSAQIDRDRHWISAQC